ncbi:MAG TPA: hypothetical protein VK178_17765, partial [Opitutaceae bacterium]|nr:hypothetical protein [Opitutaceae bacterium]
ESVRPGLGSGFRAAVQGILRLVVERPQVFAVHPATGLRRALMPRFPYVVHFEATADHVIVFAVFHAKRDPGRLSARR